MVNSVVFRELAKGLDEVDTLKVTLCLDVRRPPGNTSIESLLVEDFARNFVENEWHGTRVPEMFYDPRSLVASETTRSALHAKCIDVDGQKTLATSANFTEAAQERNIELGLLVDSAPAATQIEQHFRRLIQRGHLKRFPVKGARTKRTKRITAQE